MAWEDPELIDFEKQSITVRNLYKETPHNFELAVIEATKFLNGGESEEESEEGNGLRYYSFSKDANFIYAAFKQTHNIDLAIENIHWWKFLALFMDLGSETTFCSLIGLRKRVKTGKATKEERQVAAEMGSMFEIPDIDNRSIEEKQQDDEFMNALNRGKNDKS